MERGKYDRTQTPAARKKAQRSAIVQAATLVFARRGFAAAAVADIIEEAGISRRTFYEHFDDLASVLAAVHEASGKFAMRWVDQELADEPNARHKLERGIRALLELVSQNPGLSRVLFTEMRVAGPRYEARQEKLRAHFAELLRTVLSEAFHRGEVANAPDDISLIAIVAAIEAVGARMAADGGPALHDATEAMVRLARGTCAVR